jgi:N-formylglutamate deformylase
MAADLQPDWLVRRPGPAPVIVSVPHAGTALTPEVEARVRDPWLARFDADWYVDRLVAAVPELGITLVRTELSRTVVDVNRDPTGAPLYPGRPGTGPCPLETFDGEPLYEPNTEPMDAETAHRLTRYHAPYHAALAGEIDRLSALHPRVLVVDVHSIRSFVPRLFNGELPELNVGTFAGRSCAPAWRATVADACRSSGRSHVIDGRFQGGYITRHYGRPEREVHTVQLEIAQRAYLREPRGAATRENFPPSFDPEFAAPLTEWLRRLLVLGIAFCLEGTPT